MWLRRTGFTGSYSLLMVIACSALIIELNSQAFGQAKDSPGEGSVGASVQMLTATGGVDFNEFLAGLYKSVKIHWFAVMPAEVQLGSKGRATIRFAVKQDGSLEGDPEIEVSAGKKQLDEAALHAIKHAAPFKQFPQGFSHPEVMLRMTFFYNLPVSRNLSPN